MRVTWTAAALEELELRIQAVREFKGQAAASGLVNRIETVTSFLHTHPDLGQRGIIDGTRELSLGNIPIRLVYRHQPGSAEIIHVYEANPGR